MFSFVFTGTFLPALYFLSTSFTVGSLKLLPCNALNADAVLVIPKDLSTFSVNISASASASASASGFGSTFASSGATSSTASATSLSSVLPSDISNI